MRGRRSRIQRAALVLLCGALGASSWVGGQIEARSSGIDSPRVARPASIHAGPGPSFGTPWSELLAGTLRLAEASSEGRTGAGGSGGSAPGAWSLAAHGHGRGLVPTPAARAAHPFVGARLLGLTGAPANAPPES